MTKTTIPEPKVEELARLATLPALKSRDDIEAAGYAPGWNGAYVIPGDVVVINGHNGWRRAIATKVTDKIVHAVFTTPTNVEQAHRFAVDLAARDPLKARAAEAKVAGRNWDWFNHCAHGQPGDIWDPADRQRLSFGLTVDVIERGKAFIAENPDRGIYVDAEADKAADRVSAEARRAREDGWTAYVTVTKGQGRRDATRTNLYIMRGTIPENAQ